MLAVRSTTSSWSLNKREFGELLVSHLRQFARWNGNGSKVDVKSSARNFHELIRSSSLISIITSKGTKRRIDYRGNKAWKYQQNPKSSSSSRRWNRKRRRSRTTRKSHRNREQPRRKKTKLRIMQSHLNCIQRCFALSPGPSTRRIHGLFKSFHVQCVMPHRHFKS